MERSLPLSLWLLSCLLRESLVEMDEMLHLVSNYRSRPETALLTFRKSLERTLFVIGLSGRTIKLKVVSVETSSYSKRECFDLAFKECLNSITKLTERYELRLDVPERMKRRNISKKEISTTHQYTLKFPF